MDQASLVVQVKELQRSNLQAKEQWSQFVAIKGGGKKDPAKHEAELLQEFLVGVSSGTLDLSAAAPVGGGGDLVSQVKEMQKSDPSAKAQWEAYTDTQGAGVRDPARHTPEFLMAFIAALSSGQTFASPAGAGGGGAGLADAIKAMQKKSSVFKNVWAQFCAMNGGGKNDPHKHDENFHIGFFEFMAGVTTGGGGGMMMGAMENPAKRMRTDAGPMGMMMGGGGGPQAQLVAQVKAFQRMGTEQKELWGMYTDTYLGGVRDPSRHDAATLQEFCNNHGVPEIDMGMGGGGMGMGGMGMGGGMGGGLMGVMGGMGGLDPEKEAAVNAIKAFQRASAEGKELWGMYTDTYLGGKRDPAKHDTAMLQEFITNHSVPAAPASGGGGGMWGGAGGASAAPAAFDPAKAPLVDKVKFFQKSSPENKELWSQFAGVTKDPNRHSAEKLQEFCTGYGL